MDSITLAPVPDARTDAFVLVINGEVVADGMNFAEARRKQRDLGGTIGVKG